MNTFLISKEENIILWKEINFRQPDRYFYTDLHNNKLFGGEDFLFATPFSDSCALVYDGVFWKIINIAQKEIITLPDSLEFDALNGMRHNNIAIYDETTNHWGGYHFCSQEKTFEQNIPFIWDALEFSRQSGSVYGGINRLGRTYQADPVDGWYNWQFEVPVIKMPLEKAQTVAYYEKYLEYYENEFYQEHVRYIREKYDSTCTFEQALEKSKSNTKNAQAFADFYLDDREKYSDNNIENVEVGDIRSYQKILGKMK